MPDRLLLPIFVLFWSSGYVVGALAIEVSDPLPLLATRFVLAALVAVPLALQGGRWRGAPLGRLAVVGLLLQVVQFGGIYGGFALGVPAALGALVMLGLSPLVTTGLAIAGGQERGDARLWAGLAVGVAGVAISLAPELGSARVGAGVALTVIGMFGVAGGTVLQKRWVGVSDLRVSVATQAVTSAALVVPVAMIVGGRVDFGAQFALTLAWLGWGLGVGALSLFVRILRAHDASAVSALLLLVPAVTAIAAVPVLGEALHPATLVGMVVAMTGTGAVLRRETRVAQLDHPARARKDAGQLHRPAWEPAVE